MQETQSSHLAQAMVVWLSHKGMLAVLQGSAANQATLRQTRPPHSAKQLAKWPTQYWMQPLSQQPSWLSSRQGTLPQALAEKDEHRQEEEALGSIDPKGLSPAVRRAEGELSLCEPMHF